MLTKILIANRGEIAVRVIRACKELGIASVAVYSELDRDAMHVRLADEAYALGGQTAAESYLNTDAILSAIRRVEPTACIPGTASSRRTPTSLGRSPSEGVTFIGPPPEAIEPMGDKISARLAADRAGVVGRARHQRAVHVTRRGAGVRGRARVAGGREGGIRRRRPRHEGRHWSRRESRPRSSPPQREAQAYFGRAEVYVERYLPWPRHVEVQIIGDTHGNMVWVGERDCSAQRRHQKLIEESPAPLLSDETRRAMGEASVSVARSVGYYNAGTVEFLYADGEFFFLEMNTRLQVEHPVTEMVTGIDLVAEQIRVASGLPLSFDQSSIERRGHAIECRINAENPAGGRFLPSPGTHHEARRARRLRCAVRRRLRERRRGQPVLRQPHRQARDVGCRPGDGSAPHAPGARRDGGRGRRDDRSRPTSRSSPIQTSSMHSTRPSGSRNVSI